MSYKPSSAKFRETVFHFIFTPKFRLPVLLGHVATRLEDLIAFKCDEFDAEILALAIQPDHVHLLVALKSRSVSLGKFVGHVKGFSSYTLRKEYPHLVAQAPKALWGRDYFVRTVGGGRRAIKQYISDQNLQEVFK